MSTYTMGVDIGSAASKAVILKDGREIVAREVISLGTRYGGAGESLPFRAGPGGENTGGDR